MRFKIDLSERAQREIGALTARDRGIIFDGIEKFLRYEATIPTKKRRFLRANPLASWELRLGLYRVFYDVDLETSKIAIVAVGFKRHNVLYLGGKEHPL